ncbi:hypothetical protein SDRG_10357 [Saprolegnia diclina VS20]|uniref:Uncharacterized protein n=1 Tax=Saprolegnia diclina (strain VS20) TaxID=1156394 RepID=T0RII6_SAPDV|nr:hypothetical protein SDRG_10357 [Saprolegnia diclina VS20]EQC32163.1 hypothetical protein SDRG_10357 [Saprolegnia diclina VS20]|eukprot:XP_008614565.1 hypothetical protein SDRG_10357 [Saprolegnia diclina VS20]
MSLYDSLYHQKRAAKLAEAKLAAEDALMRKPSPTAATNQGSRATAFGRSTTPTIVPQRATTTVPVTARSIAQSSVRSTIRSTPTPATTAVQPLTASSRSSTTAAQRRTPETKVATAPSSATTDVTPASAASTTTTEAILGQLCSEVATLQEQVVDLQASLDASRPRHAAPSLSLPTPSTTLISRRLELNFKLRGMPLRILGGRLKLRSMRQLPVPPTSTLDGPISPLLGRSTTPTSSDWTPMSSDWKPASRKRHGIVNSSQ